MKSKKIIGIGLIIGILLTAIVFTLLTPVIKQLEPTILFITVIVFLFIGLVLAFYYEKAMNK